MGGSLRMVFGDGRPEGADEHVDSCMWLHYLMTIARMLWSLMTPSRSHTPLFYPADLRSISGYCSIPRREFHAAVLF